MAEQEELMNLTPDFSEATDFATWPSRTLLCSVQGIKGFLSKEQKLPMVNWKFRVEEDYEFEATDPISGQSRKLNAKGRYMFRNTPAKGTGAGFLGQVLDSLRYPRTKFRLPDSKLELINKKVYITDEIDRTSDTPMNKPKTFKPAQ